MQQNYFPPAQPQAAPAWKPKNGLGTSSLVLGTSAMTAAFCSPVSGDGVGVAFMLGVLGVVFGCIGITKARSGAATNMASAIAGLVLSPASVLVAAAAPAVIG